MIASVVVKASEDPNDILGVWLMANKNVKVKISKDYNTYYGKVIWMDVDANTKNFKVGGTIIDNMIFNPVTQKYENGHFYGRGHKLDCELKLVEKNLIEVKVSKGFVHQIRYCTRIK